MSCSTYRLGLEIWLEIWFESEVCRVLNPIYASIYDKFVLSLIGKSLVLLLSQRALADFLARPGLKRKGFTMFPILNIEFSSVSDDLSEIKVDPSLPSY